MVFIKDKDLKPIQDELKSYSQFGTATQIKNNFIMLKTVGFRKDYGPYI